MMAKNRTPDLYAMQPSLYTKFLALLAAEHDRYILWVPVVMSYGVAWYFHLGHEPPSWSGAALFAVGAVLALGLRSAPWRYGFGALALFGAGVALAQFQTARAEAPRLTAPMAYAHVSGRVAEIAPTPKGSKLVLEGVSIDGLPPNRTPPSISVSLRSYDPDLVTGQAVSLRAGLFPPPEPSLPSAFDFGRYFYFRGIGAVGYAISPLETRALKDSGASGFDIWFSEFRHRLTESIRGHFSEPAGAVAAAFVTGETRTIPENIYNDMRIAGLYHLLAVSGMNLSVVAGLAFFSFRVLLAAIPPLALRYPIKKWAALLALVASYLYLRVSGSPVSAERAFFMVSLVFIAILFDRDPMPMRSVAFAAFCILLYEPESVLSASLQLSFSATAALIASYEWGVARFSGRGKGWGLGRVGIYFAAVVASAFVAWAATEPFIIYHFNQFSSYSLIANTIAEPLVSFMLMPLVIAGVLLLPFGLASLAFAPMQYGVNLLLGIARQTAALPHAMWVLPSPTDLGFATVVLGAAWMYLWQTRWRWLGLLLVAGGLSTSLLYVAPDVLVSGDGKHVAVRLADGKLGIIKGRAENFTTQAWARATMSELADKEAVPMACDREGCVAHVGAHAIAVLKDESAAAEDCRLADVLVVNAPFDARACPQSMVIDSRLLAQGGAVAIWFTPEGIRLRRARAELGPRPWSGSP